MIVYGVKVDGRRESTVGRICERGRFKLRVKSEELQLTDDKSGESAEEENVIGVEKRFVGG